MPVISDRKILKRATKRAAGFMAGSRPAVAAKMTAMLPELAGELGDAALLRPRMVHENHDIAENGAKCGAGFIRLANGPHLEIDVELADELSPAKTIVVAAATLGPALEARITALFAERRALRALALEELATAALFELSDQITARIAAMAAAQGLGASDRYAPGDAGLPFTLQPVLHGLAGAERLGITLSGSGMMRPVKSLCFLMAIGEGFAARKPARDCATCRAREHCCYRRGGEEVVAA